MIARSFKSGLLRGAATGARKLARDERGGLLIWFAAALPAITALAVGAVELQTLTADKLAMQDAADMAALAGAKELALGTSGVTARAKALAEHNLSVMSTRYESMDVTATLGGDGKSVVVMISANRLSFFGNLLPPGGFNTLVKSAAGTMNRDQVCVLTLDRAAGDILVSSSAGVEAQNCLVHSARNLAVDRTSTLSAIVAQAVGSATGAISPAGRSGAETIPDPFTTLAVTIPTGCTAKTFQDVTVNSVVTKEQLAAYAQGGEYVLCGDFELEENADVTLPAGTYKFVGVPGDTLRAGKLALKRGAVLRGDGVTLVFDKTSKLTAAAGATINLKAPSTGVLAGMLLIAPKDNDKQFTLESAAVDVLEGVIYMPGAELQVTGGKVNEAAKWTISVTKALTVRSANLVISSNYAGSTVPVPSSVRVSSSGGDVRLLGEP